jgi:hypothetical protein
MTALNVLHAEVHRSVQDPHVVELVMQNADFGRDLASEWLKHVRWRVEPVTLPVIAGLIGTLEELTLVPVGAADRSGQLF